MNAVARSSVRPFGGNCRHFDVEGKLTLSALLLPLLKMLLSSMYSAPTFSVFARGEPTLLWLLFRMVALPDSGAGSVT